MGWAFAMGHCIACGAMVNFNPRKVPSIKGEPICRSCFERWCNLHPDAPKPDITGAYEPVAEEEL